MDERYEERDGRVYRVVTLPDVRRRAEHKPVMTKKRARALRIGKRKGSKRG